MRESGLTLALVTLDSGQPGFAVRLENACTSKLTELHRNPSSGVLLCREIRKEDQHGRTTQGMNWPAPGKAPAVKTTVLDDIATAKSIAQL
jgi:hypothetical protein